MKSLLVPFPVTLQSLEMRTDGKITGESLGIGGEGMFKFAWIIPYGMALVVFSIYSLKFLKSSDKGLHIAF